VLLELDPFLGVVYAIVLSEPHLLSLLLAALTELPINFPSWYPKLSDLNPVEPLFCDFLAAEPFGDYNVPRHAGKGNTEKVLEKTNATGGLVSAPAHPDDLLGAQAW
jgi:hypothetical protein